MMVKTLADICKQGGGSIQTGPFGSQLHQSDYREHGIAVVMPQDIVDDKISEERIARIDETLAQKLNRHLLLDGDIVFPRRGDISKRAYVSASQAGMFCGTGCLRIRVGSGELHSRWFFYFLAQDNIIKWIEGKAVGSTMLNLNTSILGSLPVEYPSYKEQVLIAQFLDAYDDLIATNQRRIQLLEEAARRLYREWFVQLRFPGHEQVKVVDGVPEGWEKQQLQDVAPLLYGKALTQAERVGGHIPVYGSSGIVGFHNKFLTPKGSIIVGRKGNIGSIFYSAETCWPIDTVFYIEPKNASYFIYLTLQHMPFISSDSAVPGLNRNYAHTLPILVPDTSLLLQYEQLASPMFGQIETLTRQNGQLKQARDGLLPKLMSGELRV